MVSPILGGLAPPRRRIAVGNHRSENNDENKGWHGHQGRQSVGHQEEARPVTFDTFNLTTYLHADNPADGSADEHFIFRVDALTQDGAPVGLPGLGTHFGMYFVLDATLAPSNG